jgi:hypothetical protein
MRRFVIDFAVAIIVVSVCFGVVAARNKIASMPETRHFDAGSSD